MLRVASLCFGDFNRPIMLRAWHHNENTNFGKMQLIGEATTTLAVMLTSVGQTLELIDTTAAAATGNKKPPVGAVLTVLAAAKCFEVTKAVAALALQERSRVFRAPSTDSFMRVCLKGARLPRFNKVRGGCDAYVEVYALNGKLHTAVF
jgi:hypothetical protein